jgi:hypothetical protein
MDDKDNLYRILSRIKLTSDGIDFIDYLKDCSKGNYNEWLRTNSSSNDLCKGKALAIDGLVLLFENCEAKLQDQKPEEPEWL